MRRNATCLLRHRKNKVRLFVTIMANQPMPRTRYGQHFLVDPDIIKEEVKVADLQPTDRVLEIGAGTGALTQELAKEAQEIIAVEPDHHCVHQLRQLQNKHKNITIKQERFENISDLDYDACVSNIPFYLSASITATLAQEQIPSVILYQKSFAERLVAEPPDTAYSRISVMTQYYMIPVYHRTVSPSAFSPPPQVHCALVKLYPRKNRPAIPETQFFQLVTALFSHNKNTVRKALKSEQKQLHLNKGDIDHFPYANRRVRELDLHALQELMKVWIELQERKSFNDTTR